MLLISIVVIVIIRIGDTLIRVRGFLFKDRLILSNINRVIISIKTLVIIRSISAQIIRARDFLIKDRFILINNNHTVISIKTLVIRTSSNLEARISGTTNKIRATHKLEILISRSPRVTKSLISLTMSRIT